MRLIPSTLVGGLFGTMLLTIVLRCAGELGYTRMDLSFLLGTTVTSNRRRAKAIGYIFHFVLGLGFAFVYAACFVVLGESSWMLGALLGGAHGLFVAAVLVNVLLPAVHPRMGTPNTAANEIALIEPPGFLMLNYGRNTFWLNLAAHVAYGAIVGGMVKL
jgi:hypothetical protein